MDDTLPIRLFIDAHCKDLGISRTELVRRLGYANQSKGLRRLDQILAGDFKTLGDIIKRLPDALEVPGEVVKQAVDETTGHLRQKEENAKRAVFKPHAIILTEIQIPRPIFIAALTNAPRHKRIDFDLTKPPSTFVSQALSILNHRLRKFNGTIPMFGKATGLVINYTFDRRADFDLKGKLLEISPGSVEVGEATLSLACGSLIGSFGGAGDL